MVSCIQRIDVVVAHHHGVLDRLSAKNGRCRNRLGDQDIGRRRYRDVAQLVDIRRAPRGTGRADPPLRGRDVGEVQGVEDRGRRRAIRTEADRDAIPAGSVRNQEIADPVGSRPCCCTRHVDTGCGNRRIAYVWIVGRARASYHDAVCLVARTVRIGASAYGAIAREITELVQANAEVSTVTGTIPQRCT